MKAATSASVPRPRPAASARRPLLLAVALLALPWLPSAAHAQDADSVDSETTIYSDLDPLYYAVVGGFGPDLGCTDYDGGQIGVSTFTTSGKELTFATGSIQILYDDGRPDPGAGPRAHECARRVQVFNMMGRVDGGAQARRVEGVSNVLLSLRINDTPLHPAPDFCTGGTVNCQWSNAYIAPADVDACAQNSSECPVEFGAVAHIAIKPYQPPTSNAQYLDDLEVATPDQWRDVRRRVRTKFRINLGELSGDFRHYLDITQMVYVYPRRPYFDISWQFDLDYAAPGTPDLTTSFFYAVDTFTSGVDFGFGYLCDVNGICGATGGSAFFQGFIGLTPPTRSMENNWARLFDQVARNAVESYETGTNTNPLGGTSPAPLRQLLDNGLVHEWSDLVLRNRRGSGSDVGPTFVQMRWTYDDPIRNNTFALSHSLFTRGEWDVPGQQTRSMIYDIITRAAEAKADVFGYEGLQSCRGSDPGECPGSQCIKHPQLCPVELPGEPCPRYCADSTCGPDEDPLTCCGAGLVSIGGFCTTYTWRTMDRLATGGNDHRALFTIGPNGSRIDVGPNQVSDLIQAMRIDMNDDGIYGNSDPVDETAFAQDILRWTRGDLLSAGAPEVIDDNGDAQVDLLNTTLLRRRTGSDNIDFVVGEVTTAAPIFVGPRPLNPSYFANQDKIPGKMTYTEFTNSPAYSQRPPRVFVAANDGAVHQFQGDFNGLVSQDAEEIWGFMPWEVLPRLREYAAPYYQQVRTPLMDLTPLVQDVYDPGSNSWRTVMIVGMRAGGMAYYAFDVTYSDVPSGNRYDDPAFLWRITPDCPGFAELGRTYSRPSIIRAAGGTPPNDETVAVAFGSGYAETTSEQFTKVGYLYIVDMWNVNGANQCPAVIYSGESANEPLSDPGNGKPFLGNVVMGSAAVDEDGDGFDDKLYLGDLAGNLWRVHLHFGSNPPVSIRSMYRTNESLPVALDLGVRNLRCQPGDDCDATQVYSIPKYPRPISTTPATAFTLENSVAGSTANNDKVMVLFGTGKFDSFYDAFDRFVANPLDGTYNSENPYFQAIYGIVDRSGTNVNEPAVEYGDLLHPSLVQGTASMGQGRVLRGVTADAGPACGANCKGWRLELTYPSDPDTIGERVVTDGVFVDHILYMTTFIPNQEGTCDLRNVAGSGGGFLMALDYRDGGNPREPTLDANDNGVVNASDNLNGNPIAGLRYDGSILSAPVVDPIAGMVYIKTRQDAPPTLVYSRPTSSFKATKTIYVRVIR